MPVVDIGPWTGAGSPEERAAVARSVDRAARTVRFMQVLGHGVPDAAVDGVAGAIDDLFGLALEEEPRSRASVGVDRATPLRGRSA